MPRRDDLGALLAALAALRGTLHANDITESADLISVELPYQAGIRFELWLARTNPPDLLAAPNNWGGEIDTDGPNPKRYVNLQGLRVVWPTGRVALDGKVVPRPAPFDPHTHTVVRS